jgi:hypothetical protein
MTRADDNFIETFTFANGVELSWDEFLTITANRGTAPGDFVYSKPVVEPEQSVILGRFGTPVLRREDGEDDVRQSLGNDIIYGTSKADIFAPAEG